MQKSLLCIALVFLSVTLSGDRLEQSWLPGLQYNCVGFRGAEFVVVRVRLPEADLQLFWKDDAGRAYGNFAHLRRDLAHKGKQLVFATNAGIYSKTNMPLGLHIQEGHELHPLNADSGKGNFFLQPNGVFFVAGGKAGVQDTKTFKERNSHPDLAVQSGPMLVLNGEINREFKADSTSFNVRNGVGIINDDEIAFVLSTQPVNLYGFADFFRTKLGCANALYLDGSISKMYIPFAARTAPGRDFVGMLGVVAPAAQK